MAKDHSIEVEWRAFELRPEGVEIPAKSPEYIERAKAGIVSLSQKYGLEMKWNENSKHSRLALEGAKFAEEKNLADKYHDVVFKAQFQQQEDINDINTLVSLAQEVGLDKEEFREALLSRKYKEIVSNDIEAAQQMGITGVPCFISNGRGKVGVQSYEELLELVNGKG